MIPEHPRGSRGPPEENLGFIKRTISKRDKEHTHRRKRTHISNPSEGGSSCTYSAASADFTSPTARYNRYPDTNAETSPSSTIPRDLPIPHRTLYMSTRSRMKFSSSTILLPTVYQPLINEYNSDTEVDIDSFRAPPSELYHSNSNLNPRGNSPIPFQFPSNFINTSVSSISDQKDMTRGVQGFSIQLENYPSLDPPKELHKSLKRKKGKEKYSLERV